MLSWEGSRAGTGFGSQCVNPGELEGGKVG